MPMGMRVLAVRCEFVRYSLRQRRQQWAVSVAIGPVVMQVPTVFRRVTAMLMRVPRCASMDVGIGGCVM